MLKTQIKKEINKRGKHEIFLLIALSVGRLVLPCIISVLTYTLLCVCIRVLSEWYYYFCVWTEFIDNAHNKSIKYLEIFGWKIIGKTRKRCGSHINAVICRWLIISDGCGFDGVCNRTPFTEDHIYYNRRSRDAWVIG